MNPPEYPILGGAISNAAEIRDQPDRNSNSRCPPKWILPQKKNNKHGWIQREKVGGVGAYYEENGSP